MRSEFDFNPIEIIIDRIIEAVPPTNDEFYTEHPVGSNAFTLKREHGR